jgi:hypothetical protein
MSVADICLLASVLVVVAIVAKMLRAIRLLDGRVSILQEQLKFGRSVTPKTAECKSATVRQPSGKTPVQGVPVVPAAAGARSTPPADAPEPEERLPGEQVPHVIDEAEAEAVWSRMEAEEERLKKAMGRDFQARTQKRSAGDIRGKPVVRSMSSQEIARKLERR